MPLQSDPHHRKVHHSRWTFGRSPIPTPYRDLRSTTTRLSYSDFLVSKGRAAILPVTIIWFSTLILLPPFGGRRSPPECAGSTHLVSRKSRKAYSAALNNQKSCVVSLPEPLSPQRYHKPSPGRIGCEECCCHLTTSYLVGVRDHGGRHDRCSGRRHQGKHQSEENEELAHVSLT